AEGDKAYLLLNDDKLECIFVRGENSFIVKIPFPSSITPEEAIGRLLEMYPILINNSSIKFIENAEELHTWDVRYGSPITLIRIGEDLKYKTVLDEKQMQDNILTPDGLSLEEKIKWVMERHPHVYVIEDKYAVKFEEKVKTEISAVDGKTPLDMDHWCVTLLTAENSDVCPCNWMGHALIIVEAIEEGGYFSRRADLIQESGKANVRFFEIDRNKTKKLSEDYSKTETYSRPKKDVQRMIYHIWLDAYNQKEGKPSVFFEFDSGALTSLVTSEAADEGEVLLNMVQETIENDNAIPLEGMRQDVYNCIKYSLRNLSLANIKPPLRSGYVLSNTFFPTPVLYKGSRVKAILQEVSLSTLYVVRAAVPFALIGLISGRAGVITGAKLGAIYGITNIASAHMIQAFGVKKEEEKKT
ncbi:MAG: hypothetical protein WBD50_03955, partial [Candidatus Rhabdochlamydia sp.]